NYADGSQPIAPTASVGAPVPGTTVSGTAVPLTPAVSDDRRVDRVDFLIDGASVASDTSSPFGVTWNSNTVANGAHSVSVRATDDAGNVTTSSAASVTVENSAPPTTGITSPAPPAGSGVTGYHDEVAADHPSGWWRLG